MARKVFTYRGKTIEELKEMPLDQFIELLPSRERRSVLRGYNDQEKRFIQKIQVKDNVKTHCRRLVILPFMIGKTVQVHRGNKFEPVLLQPEVIGQRLGQLVLSRNRTGHSSPGVGASK